MTDLGPLMTRIAKQTAAALTARPRRVLFAPGTVPVWDECCDGMLWSRLESIAPLPGSDHQPCGPAALVVTAAVGILRCAHTIDDLGQPPTPAEQTADALNTIRDMEEVAVALRCALTPEVRPLTLTSWTPLGPEGGCVGGEWLFTCKVL